MISSEFTGITVTIDHSAVSDSNQWRKRVRVTEHLESILREAFPGNRVHVFVDVNSNESDRKSVKVELTKYLEHTVMQNGTLVRRPLTTVRDTTVERTIRRLTLQVIALYSL